MRTVGICLALVIGSQAFLLPQYARPQSSIRVFSTVEAKIDYSSMPAEKLEEELRAAHNAVFAMRLEQMQSKRKEFKSSELRKLKKKIANIMPYLEEKTAAASTEEESE